MNQSTDVLVPLWVAALAAIANLATGLYTAMTAAQTQRWLKVSDFAKERRLALKDLLSVMPKMPDVFDHLGGDLNVKFQKFAIDATTWFELVRLEQSMFSPKAWAGIEKVFRELDDVDKQIQYRMLDLGPSGHADPQTNALVGRYKLILIKAFGDTRDAIHDELKSIGKNFLAPDSSR